MSAAAVRLGVGNTASVLFALERLGAGLVHVVDLDGARAGRPMQIELMRDLAGAGVPVQ